MAKKVPPQIQPVNQRAQILPSIAIGIITFLAFLPALKNGFLAWDDIDNFVTNTAFRGLGLKHLGWMFTTYHMGPYQPLSWMTSAIDFLIWGMNPMGYHFTNILLHGVNAVLFYVLTRKTLRLVLDVSVSDTRIAWASALAALFFSVHPLRVESVAWASERRDVLSGLFFLAACLCYLRRWEDGVPAANEKKWYWRSVLLFIFALLSKATAVGLLWVLIALDIYPLRRLAIEPRRWLEAEYRPVLLEKIPFVLLGAAAVLNGVFGLKEAIGNYTLPQRLAFFLYGAVFYVRKTFWPGSLSPLYEIPFHFESMSGNFLFCTVLAVAITLVLIGLYKRFPAGLLAWLVYLLIFAPVSGLAQNGPQLVAARYSYLACMPWAILLGGVVVKFWDMRFWRLAAAAGVCALSVHTWNQTKLWRDDLTLWGSALQLNPENSRAQNNYGAALMKLNRMDEAVEHYQKSIALNPYLAEAYRDMGLVLAERGKPEEAIAYYQKAQAIRPNVPEIHVNLAAAYYKLGKLDDAIENYRKALELHTPHLAETYSNLALALVIKGNLEEAIPFYQKAKELRPELPQIHNNLASALSRVGRKEEAIEEARQAIQLNPNYAKAHFLLGQLLKETGQTQEAKEHLHKAKELGFSAS